jgi:hypothetical protein
MSMVRLLQGFANSICLHLLGIYTLMLTYTWHLFIKNLANIFTAVLQWLLFFLCSALRIVSGFVSSILGISG